MLTLKDLYRGICDEIEKENIINVKNIVLNVAILVTEGIDDGYDLGVFVDNCYLDEIKYSFSNKIEAETELSGLEDMLRNNFKCQVYSKFEEIVL